jgi:hypothetical protein
MENKLHHWQGNFLTYGGRLTLLKACLSSVSLYMLSFYEIPEVPLHRFEFCMKRLFWEEKDRVKKYPLVNWEYVCQPHNMEGLGVVDLSVMNKCLLIKWLWNLETFEGIWQNLIGTKYLKNCFLSQCVRKNPIFILGKA